MFNQFILHSAQITWNLISIRVFGYGGGGGVGLREGGIENGQNVPCTATLAARENRAVLSILHILTKLQNQREVLYSLYNLSPGLFCLHQQHSALLKEQQVTQREKLQAH